MAGKIEKSDASRLGVFARVSTRRLDDVLEAVDFRLVASEKGAGTRVAERARARTTRTMMTSPSTDDGVDATARGNAEVDRETRHLLTMIR